MTELPPLELIAYAADKLGDLVDEVVFLGGAVVGLLITDPAALAPRATKDVDVAIEVSSRMDYYELEKRLYSKGFENDMRGPICRFLHGSIMVDMMPVAPEVLGFGNRWYALAMETAQPYWLESGIKINLISASCFLGTKMEAFNDSGREGHRDMFVSRDFGDVIRVIDGRFSIVEDVLVAPAELREYLQKCFARILKENFLEEAIAEHVGSGREDLVVERIKSFAAT